MLQAGRVFLAAYSPMWIRTMMRGLVYIDTLAFAVRTKDQSSRNESQSFLFWRMRFAVTCKRNLCIHDTYIYVHTYSLYIVYFNFSAWFWKKKVKHRIDPKHSKTHGALQSVTQAKQPLSLEYVVVKCLFVSHPQRKTASWSPSSYNIKHIQACKFPCRHPRGRCHMVRDSGVSLAGTAPDPLRLDST